MTFDTIGCTWNILPSKIPPVRTFHMDCARNVDNVTINGAVSVQDIMLRFTDPSVLETMSFSSCTFMANPDWITSNISLSMLKSLEISRSNVMDFELSVFQNLLCSNLESIRLSGNIGLDSWMEESLNLKTLSTSEPEFLPTTEVSGFETETLSVTTDKLSSPSSPTSSSGLTSSVGSNVIHPTSPTTKDVTSSVPKTTISMETTRTTGSNKACPQHNTTRLDLSSNGLTSLELSIFPFVSTIKTLNVENNSLSSLPSLHDLGFFEIEEINLAHNNISAIPQDFFTNLPNLVTINASHNMISNPYMNLSGTPNVKIIDLSYNKIENHTIQLLQELDQIEELYLSHNYIPAITDPNAFSNCPHLHTIDLSFNSLNQIAFIDNLPNLTTLDLSNNHLSFLSPGLFYNVENLQSLNLANNLLTNFHKFPYLNLHSNITVDVNILGNPLDCDCEMGKSILNPSTAPLPNWPYRNDLANQRFLNYTSLVCNETHRQIASWLPGPYYVFNLYTYNTQYRMPTFLCDYPEYCPSSCSCYGFIDGFEDEEFTTDCSGQNLIQIPSDIYNHSKVIELAWNNIQRIPSNHFAHCGCLQTLDLRGNNITIIEQDAFVESLTNLILSYNNLQTIKSWYFMHLPNLIQLHLSFNNIGYIEPNSFKHLNHLVHLDLSYNQLTSLPDPFLYTKHIQFLSLQNNTLEELPSVLVAESGVNDGKDFRDGWRPTLFLRNNQLTSIPDGLIKGTNMLHPWEVVYLENNHLHYLPEQLSQTDNENLEALYLHDNNLTTLPNHVFDHLREDIYLSLHNNPWNCNCSLSWLPEYLANVRYSQVEGATIFCDTVFGENTHTALFNLSHDQFCPPRPVENKVLVTSVGSVIGGLLVVVVVVTGVVYHKREYIRIILYKAIGFKPLQTPGNFEYMYDIFISHHEKDSDFVVHTLRPMLEERKYKTCVRQINILPGTSELETIQEAIEGSRRIIIIVTQNYVNSECESTVEFEYNQALWQSMREHTDTLLLVQVGDLEQESIPQNMHKYMGRKNWLRYCEADRMFWDKIFVQLPPPLKDDLKPDAMAIALQHINI